MSVLINGRGVTSFLIYQQQKTSIFKEIELNSERELDPQLKLRHNEEEFDSFGYMMKTIISKYEQQIHALKQRDKDIEDQRKKAFLELQEEMQNAFSYDSLRI